MRSKFDVLRADGAREHRHQSLPRRSSPLVRSSHFPPTSQPTAPGAGYESRAHVLGCHSGQKPCACHCRLSTVRYLLISFSATHRPPANARCSLGHELFSAANHRSPLALVVCPSTRHCCLYTICLMLPRYLARVACSLPPLTRATPASFPIQSCDSQGERTRSDQARSRKCVLENR